MKPLDLVLTGATLAMLACGSPTGSPDDDAMPGDKTDAAGGDGDPGPGAPKTVDSTGALQVAMRKSGPCTVVAPKDWIFQTDQYGWGADAFSTDGRLYTGWGISPSVRAAEGYYADENGDPNGDPATSILWLANTVISQLGDPENAHYTSEPTELFPGFQYRFLETAAHKGIVGYFLYDLATLGPYVEGKDYIRSMYGAITTRDQWDGDWQDVATIAGTIRCTAQARPDGSSSGAGKHDGPASDDSGDSEYNQWLGTEYYHSPGSCDSYLVSPSEDWWENGPEGAGYYRQVGNDLQKLEPGLCE